MKKKIAFYYQDLPQKHLFEYIANKVNKKKFDVIFTKNLNIKSDFGFYSDVPKYIDKNNQHLFLNILKSTDLLK